MAPKLRELVLERDRRRCTRCGVPAAIVHHRIPISQGGGNTLDNMETVCARCHEWLH